MPSHSNPLQSHAADDAVRQLTTILAGNPVDGAAVIADLRAYFETAAVQDEMIRQVLNLYGQNRRMNSADLALGAQSHFLGTIT